MGTHRERTPIFLFFDPEMNCPPDPIPCYTYATDQMAETMPKGIRVKRMPLCNFTFTLPFSKKNQVISDSFCDS